MMIIDSHCHAWERWPYKSPVPDPDTRGRVEQLLYEMDECGVGRAMIVCAGIDFNPDNNAYVAQQVALHPGRLSQWADLDCLWSPTYHTPGAARRLSRLAEQYPISGITHYLKEEDDAAWLHSPDGLELLNQAAGLGLIFSLSSYPHQQPAIRRAAEQVPNLPILLHHLGHPAHGPGSLKENVQEIVSSARLPNIYIKLSGFAYAAPERPWDYPYDDILWIVQAEYDSFGPQRMCWGSDYPVVRFYMTYRQALEAFRTHCAFVPTEDQAWILGGTIQHLLGETTAGQEVA